MIVSDKQGIFVELQKIKDYAFFNSYDASDLDMMLDTFHGNKQLFLKINGYSIEKIAKLIYVGLDSYFENLINSTLTENGIFSEIETITTNQKEENETEQTAKISGFDSANLIPDSQNIGAENKDKNVETTRKKIDVNSAFKLLDFKVEYDLVSNVVSKTANLISLEIYP